MGTGTLSAYANEAHYMKARHKMVGDYLRFYEINPQVIRFAKDHFTFVQDARDRGADVEVLQGDARMVMQRQLEQNEAQDFDVLVVDAFSGDSLPMHLLTQECFDIYFRHLKPDGILVVQISNLYLNLFPVVRGLAEIFGKEAQEFQYLGDSFGNISSRWALVTANERFLQSEKIRERRTPTDERQTIVWTDDFASLFSVIE